MNTMNVIIADDHPIVLFGIRKSLEQIEWVNVVGEFEDSTALINNLPKLDAHVLITDLSMPGNPQRGAGSGYRRDRPQAGGADRSA